MSDLIKQVGGIEKARFITDYAPANPNYRFYSLNIGNGNSGWHVDFRDDCIDLGELHQAITDYNTVISDSHINEADRLNRLG